MTSAALCGRRVLVVAAGTGGHVLPGIEVGRALQGAGAEVHWVCGTREAEARSYAAAGIAPITVPWPGSGAGRRARLAALSLAMPRALGVLRRVRPDAVVSMGGGFGAPFLALARALGIPILQHDSNAVPGRVTRWFAGHAHATMLGLPIARPLPRAIETGTPARPMPERRPTPHPTVVVMGGSQGARRLNQVAIEAARHLRAPFPALEVTILGHRTDGTGAPLPAGVTTHEFLGDPGPLLAGAWVVVSRSGAGTLAELAALGVPALLVPYPHAKDDHQAANARVFAEAGAARLLPEGTLDAAQLAREIAALLGDAGMRARMEAAMARLHRPHAREHIVQVVAESLGAGASAPAGSHPPFLPKGSQGA